MTFKEEVERNLGKNTSQIEEKEEITEDVLNFKLTPEEIDYDETEPVTTVEAKLYFETESKTDKEAEKICKSSDFKKDLEALLKKYF